MELSGSQHHVQPQYICGSDHFQYNEKLAKECVSGEHRRAKEAARTQNISIINKKKIWQISDTDGVSLTSEQALTWAIRMAQHFKKRGLDDSSVIGIAARNTTYIMPLGVACLLNATPFHSINPILDEGALFVTAHFDFLD